jgi:SAM-dependent methyltransferase
MFRGVRELAGVPGEIERQFLLHGGETVRNRDESPGALVLDGAFWRSAGVRPQSRMMPERGPDISLAVNQTVSESPRRKRGGGFRASSSPVSAGHWTCYHSPEEAVIEMRLPNGTLAFEERRACPVCLSPRRQQLYECAFDAPPVRDYLAVFYNSDHQYLFTPLTRAAYILDECLKCGLVYQRYVANEALMARLYGTSLTADRPTAAPAAKRTIHYYAHLAREVEDNLRYLGRPPGELTFFDFGAGLGDWCRMARAYGCKVAGTEISLGSAAAIVSSGIEFVRRDELAGRQFDVVNAEQVFEHLAEPRATLEELTGSLAPGGLLKIGVPNGNDIKRRLARLDWSATKGSRDSLNPVAPLEHVNCFSHASLVALGAGAGLLSVDPRLASRTPRRPRDRSVREILRGLARPLQNSGLGHRGTSLFFRRPAASSEVR